MYKGYRFLREIISHCVWLYHRVHSLAQGDLTADSVVKLIGVQLFSGEAGRHAERCSDLLGQLGNLIPHLESAADFGAVAITLIEGGGVMPCVAVE